MSKRLVGIIGGMGPLATAVFMERIVELTDAQCDQDHVRSIIINATDTPDRSRHLLESAQSNAKECNYSAQQNSESAFLSPFFGLSSAAAQLESAGCEVIAIPCNTAHHYWNRLQQTCHAKIISMVNETAEECALQGYKHIAVLGTDATVSLNLYDDACRAFGLSLVYPSPSLQLRVASMIQAIKRGAYHHSVFWELLIDTVSWATEEDADCLVLGCTELSAAFQKLSSIPQDDPPFYHLLSVPIVDAMDVLALRTIEYAGYRTLQSTSKDVLCAAS